MNRRQKIIVSVVGIFIVLLALLGITYAYFLTRIQGNTNTTSISVTTADLALVYDGDNGSIIGKNEVIEPDKTFDTKTFTVENKGKKTIDAYAVILEEVSITDATTEKAVPLNSTRDGYENDFDLVIKCNDGTEEKVVYNGELPEENAILVTNSIEPGEVHTYSATLTYVETNEDQSGDMNKRITGKFNIIDTKDTANLSGNVSNMGTNKYYVQTNSTKRVSYIDSEGNYTILGLEAGLHTLKLCNSTDTTCADPVMIKEITVKTGTTASTNITTAEITTSGEYKNATININASGGTTEIKSNVGFNNPYNKGTLAYNIINTARNRMSGTQTQFVEPSNLGNAQGSIQTSNPSLSVCGNNEQTLSHANDNYGTSYYFRGNVNDNFVNFAGMCWRIVRIEGDGSIKLILEDKNVTCENASYNGNWDIGTASYGFVKTSENGATIGNYENPVENEYNTTTSMKEVYEKFEEEELAEYQEYLISRKICTGKSDTAFGYDKSTKKSIGLVNDLQNAGTSFWYESRVRIDRGTISFSVDPSNPQELTLGCASNYETTNSYKVMPLTIDEAIHTGGQYNSSASGLYWLINKFHKGNVDGNPKSFFLASYRRFDGAPTAEDTTLDFSDNVFHVSTTGNLIGTNVYNELSTRPSIVIKPGIEYQTLGVISVNNIPGSRNNPYVIG